MNSILPLNSLGAQNAVLLLGGLVSIVAFIRGHEVILHRVLWEILNFFLID
jgi:hypothetical protein